MKHKLLAVSLLCLALSATSVHATLLYWSANGSTVAGSGTWDTGNHWGTSTSGPFTTAWNNANSDTALFPGIGTAFAVSLGMNATINGTLQLELTPGTYPDWTFNLNTSTLTFAPGSTLQANGGCVLNCKYAGTITKNGAGYTTFNNSGGSVTKFIFKGGNSYFASPNRFGSGADNSGFLTFDGGLLRMDTTTAWTQGKSITVNSGNGTIMSYSSTITLTQDKPITFNGGNLSLARNGSTPFTCILSGTGSSGSGTLTVSVPTTCNAANVISSGAIVTFGYNTTINLNNNAQTISSLSGTGTITLGSATLTLANGRHTFAGAISGTGGLVQNSSSFETLSGNNTYSGATTINSGALVFSGASTCTGVTTVNSGGMLQIATSGTAFPSSPIVLAGGTLDVNNLSVTIAALSGTGVVSNNAGQTLTVNGNLTTGGTFQDYSCYSGTLTNGSLYKSGTHAMAMRGSNTFDGTLTFDNGTLSVGAAPNRLPTSLALAVGSGALFQLDANSQTFSTLTPNAGNGNINLGGGTLTVNPGDGSTFSGILQNSELAGSSTALGHGLRGYYYDNIDMTSLKTVTDNAPVNSTWGPPNGYALACNGASTGYGALVTPSGSLTGTFTVECWACPSNTTANMSMIGTRKPTDFGFDMKFMGGKPLIHGDIGNGTAWATSAADATFTFVANTWYHIAYVVTPTSYTIYANGSQIGTGTYASTTPILYDANHNLYIGQYGNGEYFNGQLGEVRIWNTARTATDIQTSMNQRLTGGESGLVGYWRCDDGSGTTLTAAVGVNGTLAASTGWAASGPFTTTAYYHSARWLGQVLTTAAGTYTFTTATGDGARLWVNGTLVIDGWVSQGATARSGTIALAANTRYDIVMECFNDGGASLSWTPPGDTTTNVIPAGYLFLPGAGQLVKAGSGTQVLGAANTYTGTTTVTGGAASVLEAAVDGALGGGNVVVNDATLTLDSSVTISANADVLLSGSTSPLVNLNFSGINNIHALSFDGGATYLPTGTYGTTAAGADHPDDVRFASSTGAGLLNVTGGPSTITLASSASPAVYGSPVNLTATVTSGVTGTVTFYDGANFLGTANLSGSPFTTATLSVSNLQVTASPHSITAVYNGDATHSPRTSSSVSITTTLAPLTPNVVVANKVYDGTTNATISSATTFTGIYSGDTNYVHIVGTAVANFRDKNVGTAKPVDVTGMALAGSLASNYSMAATTATVSANITNKVLTISGITATNRVYDATMNEGVTGAAALNAGIISPDVVNLIGGPVVAFTTKTVGTAKPVTVSGYSLSGADAGNYILVQTNLSANITQSPISVGNLSVITKTYDGTNSATLTGSAALSPAPFLSDVVTLGGTAIASFNNKNAGVGKAVTVIGYTISNTDAANYNLSQPPGLTGTINPVPTSCVLVSSVNPSTNSQNVTFTATITANPLPVVPDAPTSTVSFSTNGIPQVSITVVSNAPGVAKAVWSTTGLYLGTSTVLAAYLTDGNYQASNNSLTQTVQNASSASAVTISNIIGTTLTYGGGAGAKFILLKSASVATPMSAWTYPGLTNTTTPGSFTIPAVGTGSPVFYRVLSQ